ncbi:MAG: hypothetical protein ACPG8V_04915 [Alphaproteobacteria bacterium]
MGQALPVIGTILQMEQMDEAESRQRKKQQAEYEKRQAEIEKKKASMRAKKYVGGFDGRSYDKRLNQMKNEKNKIYSDGSNMMNKINLFAQMAKDLGK